MAEGLYIDKIGMLGTILTFSDDTANIGHNFAIGLLQSIDVVCRAMYLYIGRSPMENLSMNENNS
jgi:hypothetical protein